MVAIRRVVRTVDRTTLRGRLTLVPVVNEAAFARGDRVAEDGLDLARTCPGKADGSVTERVAYALSNLIRSADYYIDLHTGGTKLAVWPLAGYMLHHDAEVLEKQRLMARAFNLPVVWGTDAKLEGRSLSVARDAKVPAIYAEYLGGGQCSAPGIEAYVDGCLNVLAALKMLDRPPQPSRVQFVVEDPRPSSGHMQRCYPAPRDGFFEAFVELGEPIRSGQPIGRIVDVLGSQAHEIIAQESGRILVLRTFPAVRKGDSLAVILPIDVSHD
jgi:predicted deacylase